MKNNLLSNLKQGILSLRFAICTAVIALAPYLLSVEQLVDAFRRNGLLQPGFHNSFILKALTTNGFAFVTPLAAAAVLSGIYLEDLKSHFIRYYLIRSTRKQYIIGRLFACFCSGALVLFVGILLSYCISALLFLPIEQAVTDEGGITPDFRDVFCAALPFFLSGGFWAVFGLTMSSFMESKYIAYASPFIFFYILVILYERYFDMLFIISPKEWLTPSDNWVVKSWGPVAIVSELTLLTALIFALRAEMRLSQL